jgi:hypothetical protein
MSKFNRFNLIALVCILALAVSSPCWGANTIKIGVIGPMQTSRGMAQ